MSFSRFAIKKMVSGEPDNYVTIGTGYEEDISRAHLYTSYSLAEQKVLIESKAYKDWAKYNNKKVSFKIVEFNVEVKDGV